MKTLFIAALTMVIFTVAVAADTQNNGGTGNIIFASQNGDVHHHGDTYRGEKIKVSRHGYAAPVEGDEERHHTIKPDEFHPAECGTTVIYKDRLLWWLLPGFLLVGTVIFALRKRKGKAENSSGVVSARDTNIVDVEFEAESLPALNPPQDPGQVGSPSGPRGKFPKPGTGVNFDLRPGS